MIQFLGLTKRFGSRTVLDNISFSVGKGEIVFILGTSGTGKSVLLKNLVGLMKPEAGQILVNERDIVPFSERQLQEVRKKVGMVFQQPALFDSLSIFENVAFGLRKHYQLDGPDLKAKVSTALAQVHLSGVEEKFPAEISYGMQKRASLARTVALNPEVLLFDEPTTGLDPITTKAVNELILELSRSLKTTSIVVSHDMQCAIEIADRIIVLDKGKIIDQGTPQEMLKSEQPLVKDFLAELKESKP
jgi:phospholipid/cholesterol/gamma-HCH transport system ATP-binding protein